MDYTTMQCDYPQIKKNNLTAKYITQEINPLYGKAYLANMHTPFGTVQGIQSWPHPLKYNMR